MNRIFGLLVVAALVGGGLGLIALAGSEPRWEAALSVAAGARGDMVSGGALLAVLGLLYLLTGYRRRRREKFLSFETENGTISISTEAISDYITKLAGEFSSIVRMWTRVLPAKRTIDIVVDVWVRAGAQVHEVCELLQRRIREQLAAGLGISDVRRVEVSVRDIVSEHRLS
ncbi:MAG: alkaline shock response membrane anchor protein AmaP [Lentisphaerae bacterium]|nr:alkaline shock response membrane anchor protein AmaP [Lentisphaerota bacterium]